MRDKYDPEGVDLAALSFSGGIVLFVIACIVHLAPHAMSFVRMFDEAFMWVGACFVGAALIGLAMALVAWLRRLWRDGV